MESKLGALWKPKTSNENAPLANGVIDFERMSEEDIKAMYEALTAKEKFHITIWKNKRKTEDRFPDFEMVRANPYNKEAKPSDTKRDSNDIPF